MSVIVGDLIARRSDHASAVASGGLRPWEHPAAADVIKRGYERAEADQGRDNDDPDLTADEAAAGALWAKAHHPASTDQCPLFMKAFRQGCMDYVKKAAGR